MKASDIADAIVTSNLSAKDRQLIVEALKASRAHDEARSKMRFAPNDLVKFVGRGGKMLTGVVVKLKPKFVLVRTTGDLPQLWNVNPTHLSKAA